MAVTGTINARSLSSILDSKSVAQDTKDFIVRAVNDYQGLIDAVKDLRKAFYQDGTPKAVKEAFHKHIDFLRQAIAKAEGRVG